jgi:uncharacterized protein
MVIAWWMYLAVCPLIFLASFVDAIAGGGGILSLPAYLLTGMPAQYASGCNKFSASSGTLVATIKYFKSNQVDMYAALLSAVFALIGSYLGALIAISLDSVNLKLIMLFAIPFAAFSVLLSSKKQKPMITSKPLLYFLCIITGFFIGGYDGLIGPGTGTFLILVYTYIIGFDITKSSGNAKVVNLASNLAALTAFIINGYVIYALAIPAAFCAIAGGYFGSHLAIKNGAKIIKPLLYIVLTLIFIKLIFDIING